VRLRKEKYQKLLPPEDVLLSQTKMKKYKYCSVVGNSGIVFEAPYGKKSDFFSFFFVLFLSLFFLFVLLISIIVVRFLTLSLSLLFSLSFFFFIELSSSFILSPSIFVSLSVFPLTPYIIMTIILFCSS